MLGGVLFLLMAPAIRGQQANLGPVTVCQITTEAARSVLGSRAAFAILMVGLGDAIFGGLSSFQTFYATLKNLDYSLFFIGFISAPIACRLLVSGFIVKRDPYPMACLLTALMVVSVLMFSLACFIGAFGFPLLAGKIIVQAGIPTLLDLLLAIAVANWAIPFGRLVWRSRRRQSTATG